MSNVSKYVSNVSHTPAHPPSPSLSLSLSLSPLPLRGGSSHTYVLTAIFPFRAIARKFCPALVGVHQSDCADI